jgi:hypothetical protein
MSAAATRCGIPPGDEWWYQCIAFGEAPAGVGSSNDEGPVITYLEAITRLNNDVPPRDKRRNPHAADRVRGQRLLLGSDRNRPQSNMEANR